MVPIQRRIVWVILFVLAASVGGCSTTYKSYTAYGGPPRPTEEIAVLHCDGRCGRIYDRDRGGVHDLRPIHHFWSSEYVGDVFLEPRKYGIAVRYWGARNIYSSDYYTGFQLDFQAGHTYRVLHEAECKVFGFGERTADVWIKDETTDTIVAERHGLRHNCN